jgi:hypothetical protein
MTASQNRFTEKVVLYTEAVRKYPPLKMDFTETGVLRQPPLKILFLEAVV